MNDGQQNKRSRFEDFSFSEKQLLYRGLLALVNANSGYGFINHDQGHPAYVAGRSGDVDADQWGDSPERNTLFRLMHTLSMDLSAAELDRTAEIADYVFCWADFCTLAYGAYERSRHNG